MGINYLNLLKSKQQKNRNISLIIGILLFSLGISLLMNWYNKRIAIQEK